jgi:hypothetical protein
MHLTDVQKLKKTFPDRPTLILFWTMLPETTFILFANADRKLLDFVATKFLKKVTPVNNSL